jgi:hypothetical protein
MSDDEDTKGRTQAEKGKPIFAGRVIGIIEQDRTVIGEDRLGFVE